MSSILNVRSAKETMFLLATYLSLVSAWGQADMIVTSIHMSPASPKQGQAVTFSATIKNQGDTATPEGVKNGVVFSINGATATWSDDNTESIPPGGSVTVTANGGPTGSSTWTASNGAHSLDAWVNDAQRYPESNWDNNHMITTITVADSIADMIVTAISMSPAVPVAGDEVTFSATIKNQGTKATPEGVKNGVVFSINGTAVTWSDNHTSSIPSGGSVTVTANGGPSGKATWTATTGSHVLDAWVNDAERYDESNWANNHRDQPLHVGYIDMIVTGASMSPANPVEGQAVTFSATIKNQGTAPTPAGIKNGVVFSVDGATATWSDDNTESIPPGGSVTVTANGGPTGSSTWIATAGSHTLDTWVNDARRYPESDWNNNHLITSFTVAEAMADMIVVSSSMSPADPVAGQDVTFSATIKNQGTLATPAGVINGVVFSINGSTATWSDNHTDSIPPGGTVTVTANGGPSGSSTWTATTGTHTLDCWVNDAERYPESNWDNNHLISSFTVGYIDMIVTGISMDPPDPVAGQLVTFKATIKNQGTASTPGGTIRNGVVFSVDGSVQTWSDNNFDAIPPGGSVTVTANGGPTGSSTWTATAGTHSVDAWVNDALVYPESDTSNNHLIQSITIPSGGTPGPYGQDPNLYTLTFSDEFNGTGLDFTKWNDHIWYESSHPDINYAVEDGLLKIWPMSSFVNRTIDTDGKFEQTYGFYEAEMKLCIGKGTWPAFWLYAHPPDARPEIDIMEAYPGGGPDSGWGDSNLHPINYGMTLHRANADYSYHEVPYATKYTDFKPALDLSAGFHKYGVKWTPTTIAFYFDGEQIGPTYNYSDSYYNRAMYVLLDLWFGSASGTPDSTTPTGKGNSFEINYVRVWQFIDQVSPYGQDPNLYTLTFSDEFNGTSLDGTKWNDHIWYESSHPDINYGVEDGLLKIWPMSSFVNRTIDTDGKFEQTYGYFEADMRLCIGKGTWPAFWLYAHPPDARPEIDIMEAYPGGGPDSGWGDSDLHPINYGLTLHRANADYSYHEVPYAIKYTDFKAPIDLSAAFHKYGVKWTSDSISFYFDGEQIGPTYNYSDSYYNRPMYVLLDLWFGSASGTPDSTTPTGKGNSFEIDYVRVWQFK